MDIFLGLLLIAGGAFALLALKLDLEKLAPVQAFVGVAMFAMGVAHLMQIGPRQVFRITQHLPLTGIAAIGATYGAIALGAYFGLPLVAQARRKIAPFQIIFGIICFGAGVLVLLFHFRIVKAM